MIGFSGSFASELPTWHNHEDAICHDEHLHRRQGSLRDEHSPMLDEMRNQLHVKKRAEPANRECVHDNRSPDESGVSHVNWFEMPHGAGLHHCKCDPPANGHKGDDGR